MFNHHFFDGEASKRVFLDFLVGDSDDKALLILDPPFGGLVEPLARTVRLIREQWENTGNHCSKVMLTVTVGCKCLCSQQNLGAFSSKKFVTGS